MVILNFNILFVNNKIKQIKMGLWIEDLANPYS